MHDQCGEEIYDQSEYLVGLYGGLLGVIMTYIQLLSR